MVLTDHVIIATREATAIGKIDSRFCVFVTAERDSSGFGVFNGHSSDILRHLDLVV